MRDLGRDGDDEGHAGRQAQGDEQAGQRGGQHDLAHPGAAQPRRSTRATSSRLRIDGWRWPRRRRRAWARRRRRRRRLISSRKPKPKPSRASGSSAMEGIGRRNSIGRRSSLRRRLATSPITAATMSPAPAPSAEAAQRRPQGLRRPGQQLGHPARRLPQRRQRGGRRRRWNRCARRGCGTRGGLRQQRSPQPGRGGPSVPGPPMKSNSSRRRRRNSGCSRVVELVARAGQGHVEHGRDPARMRPQRHHAVAEVDRLLQVVGDEQDRHAGGGDQARAPRPARTAGSWRPGRRTARPSAAATAPGRGSGQSAAAAACRRTGRRGSARRDGRGRPSSATGRSGRPGRHAARRRPRAPGTRCPPPCARAAAHGHNPGTPRPRRRRGRRPACRCSGPRPRLGRSSPASSRSSVVLPQPEGPTTQVKAPGAMPRSMPRRIGWPARSRSTPRNSITGAAASASCLAARGSPGEQPGHVRLVLQHALLRP